MRLLFVMLLLLGSGERGAHAAAANFSISQSPGGSRQVGPSSYLDELTEQARSRRLASTRDWHVLLHYRTGPLGAWRSEADGPDFFLAGNAGRKDPEAELEATLAGFFGGEMAENQHARCRFPARFAWLVAAMAIDLRRLPSPRCPAFENWRHTIAAQVVTLVYASAYLNSPASMYGHTFLRLSRGSTEVDPLLDYAVSFAADVDTKSGLAYAWKGLTGGFIGNFEVMPYYVKVQEYSSMESRDLWEYELTLTAAQVDRLVGHAWEMRTTYFDYYFFTRNCSYQLLTLLEVADPSLHLIDSFGVRVIPADTVRVVLAQPGLVRRSAARASLLSRMLRRRAALSPFERRVAESWATSPDFSAEGAEPASPIGFASLSPPRQALVLDTAHDYARYRDGGKGASSLAFKRRERAVLLARERLGNQPQAAELTPINDAPELGHPTLRVTLGGGMGSEGGAFETLAVRGAIHDYLEASPGYPRDAQLQMANVRIRYANSARTPQNGALRLDRLDAIDILSAAPSDAWMRRLSWKAWAGADNARELGCERETSDRHGWRCLYAGVSAGAGLAARYGPGRAVLTYVLGVADVGAGPAFARAGYYRVGGGVQAGFNAAVTERWRMEISGHALFYALGEHRDNLRARLGQSVTISRNLELRLLAETAASYIQVSFEMCAYVR